MRASPHQRCRHPVTRLAVARGDWPDARRSPASQSTQVALNDGNGAYRTGRHPNLFVERLNKTPAETRQRIDRAFKQFFHGDGQEERVCFETGANKNGPLAYITDWANNDARSEGMSYGMMIAVQLDKSASSTPCGTGPRPICRSPTPKNPSSATSRGPWVPTARRVPPAPRRTAKSGS